MKAKTVLQHLIEIDDADLRHRCLDNLDHRYAEYECYAPGMALMLGVFQHSNDKQYWENAYAKLHAAFEKKYFQNA